MTKQLILTVGVPGSGKSTLLKKISKNINCKIISRDKIRFSLVKENEPYFSQEKKCFNQFIDAAKEALKLSDVVFMDATHISPASRNKVLRALGKNLKGVSCSCLVMDVPIGVCLTRNAARQGRARVPEDTVRNMFNSFQMPTFEEGFDKIILYRENDEYHFRIKVKEL